MVEHRVVDCGTARRAAIIVSEWRARERCGYHSASAKGDQWSVHFCVVLFSSLLLFACVFACLCLCVYFIALVRSVRFAEILCFALCHDRAAFVLWMARDGWLMGF